MNINNMHDIFMHPVSNVQSTDTEYSVFSSLQTYMKRCKSISVDAPSHLLYFLPMVNHFTNFIQSNMLVEFPTASIGSPCPTRFFSPRLGR
jgi:hypothetical protein